MPATLVQINTSAGGMPKLPVLFARVTFNGVEGDRQRIKKIHGGANRAVCLYSEELYAWLRENGINVSAGQIGENFTTRGIDLQTARKGDRLKVGEACVVELTEVREPCNQLKKWSRDLPRLLLGRSGWMAKVVVQGTVRCGDAIEMLVGSSDGQTVR